MADLGEQTITDRRTGAVRLRSARTVALVGFLAAPRRVSADPAHADSAGGRDAGRGCSRGSARCWIRTARRPVSGAQPAPGRVAGRCRGAAQHGACPCGAGVGKSRLVAEVAEMARLQGAIVASTQCFATSGRLALAPVADWLRNPAVRSAASALEPAWRGEVERLVPSGEGRAEPVVGSRAMVDAWQRHRFFEGLA